MNTCELLFKITELSRLQEILLDEVLKYLPNNDEGNNLRKRIDECQSTCNKLFN